MSSVLWEGGLRDSDIGGRERLQSRFGSPDLEMERHRLFVKEGGESREAGAKEN